MYPNLRPKGLITLVTRNSTNIYSGMLPGVISGIYELDESLIDLRYLAYKAGIAFIAAEIIGISKLTVLVSKVFVLAFLGKIEEEDGLSKTSSKVSESYIFLPIYNNKDYWIKVQGFFLISKI